MFDDESNRAVKAFEARLAALRPSGVPSPFPATHLAAPDDRDAVEQSGVCRPIHACDTPAGHRFVCIYCGVETTRTGGHRWQWPAVAAGLAALLLLMATTGWRSQLAIKQLRQPAAILVDDVTAPGTNSARTELTASRSYLSLRSQAIRDGIDSAVLPATPGVTPSSKSDIPLTYREALDRVLKQKDSWGS